VNDDLQTLFAKFLQYAFTQKVGIAFAGSRKLDNSLGDHFVGEVESAAGRFAGCSNRLSRGGVMPPVNFPAISRSTMRATDTP
jgi:hypothetical protein